MKAVLFLAIGVALLMVAGITSIGTLRFLREAARAEGTVVALNAGGSHPQVRFQLPDGRPVSYPQGGWISGYRVGDRVIVRYEAGNPVATARIDAIGSLWVWPIALGFIGAIFTIVGIVNRTGAAEPRSRTANGIIIPEPPGSR
jgi:hypothetical protein